MKILFATLLIASVGLVGCTIAPKHVDGNEAAYDPSTPAQYNPYNNGYLGQILVPGETVKSGLLTPGGRSDYNDLIDKYASQYAERYARKIKVDDGIRPYVDQFGNGLYVIDKAHLKVFMTLCQWSRDNKPGDSLIQKLAR